MGLASKLVIHSIPHRRSLTHAHVRAFPFRHRTDRRELSRSLGDSFLLVGDDLRVSCGLLHLSPRPILELRQLLTLCLQLGIRLVLLAARR